MHLEQWTREKAFTTAHDLAQVQRSGAALSVTATEPLCLMLAEKKKGTRTTLGPVLVS